MNLDFTHDLERARERISTKEINGVSYTIQCTDPYGHWHVVGIPEEGHRLSGSFTSPSNLWMAIKAYEDEKASTKKPLPKEDKKKV